MKQNGWSRFNQPCKHSLKSSALTSMTEDRVLRVRVADVPAYDACYKRLISRISVSDISASFVMEEIKDTTAVPL